MGYPFSIPGFEGQELSVEYSGWNGAARLLVDAKPAASGGRANRFQLIRSDGSQVDATVVFTKFGLVPVVQIEGRNYPLPSPLRWYHWPLIALPLLLVGIGGMLGAVFGSIGFVLNARILSGDWPGWLKVLAALGITALMIALFYLAAGGLSRLLGG